MAATELYKAIAQPSEHSFLNRFDVNEEALKRVRQREPGEAAVAAGGELPPEARHDVVHGHQRLHPGELDPGAQPLPAAERHERVGRRLALEPGWLELVQVQEYARAHVRLARRPEHLPPLGDAVVVELDVLRRPPEAAEDGRDRPQSL